MIPALYQNLQRIIAHYYHIFKAADHETPAVGRPKKISDEHALVLACYQHQSTRATKKSVYDDFKEVLACSYKTFVVSVNRVALLTLRFLSLFMRGNRARSHLVKYTDATDIPVCLHKNANAHRTMRGLSGFGRSSKGWYFGLKMTITRDANGQLLAVLFSKANANDRDLCRKINKDINGIIVLDAGYVSGELERDMDSEGLRWLLIRPYKTMKKLMTKWQEDLYRGRFQIEFDFRNLKLFHGLVTSLPRSVNGYFANYIHALTSFVLRRAAV